jgi:hypothetical protein
MVATRHVIGRQRPDGSTSLAPLKAAIALALLVVVVIVVGGYGFSWRWTGLSGRIISGIGCRHWHYRSLSRWCSRGT